MSKRLLKSVKRDIVQLGEVTFDRRISFDAVQAALSLAQQAEESNKAATFTNNVLSEMLANPSLTSAQVAGLSDHVVSALVATAAEVLGIQEGFDGVPPDLPARERFYRSYQKWFSITIGAAVAGLARQARVSIGAAAVGLSEQVRASMGAAAAGLAEQVRVSTFNAIAPVRVSIPVLKLDYGALVAPLVESLQAFSDSQSQVLKRISERFAELGKIARQRLDAAELNAQVIAPLLAQSNLWISPSMPLSFLRELRKVVDGGNATPEAVEKLFLKYFRADEWAELREMVLSWESNPHFKNRMPIILDALQAHINGKFTLSVPALLPHVEGVTSDILGKSVFRDTKNQVSGMLEQGVPEFLRSVYKDTLIEFITNIVYGWTDFNNFASDLQSKGIAETDFLNRHAILHGVHVNYANEGLSLRAFLLLEALSTV